MRRALTTLAVASCLLLAGSALAADDPPPPPPPPPPSDTTTDDEKKDDESSSSSSGGGGFRATDALLDASKGKKRPMMLSFFAGFAYPYYVSSALSLGARFNIPLVHDGFVPQINDSFDLEFGLDVGLVPWARGFGAVFFLPIVEPRYTVYLLPNLAVYAKPLCLGVTIWPNTPGTIYFHYHFAVGVVFEITKTIYLRGELATNGIRGGLGIAF